MKRTPFCTLFLGALDDFMLKLLLVCAVVSISFDLGFAHSDERKTGTSKYLLVCTRFNINFILAWIEGAAIFLAVFIVSGVGSYNDYKKEE